MDQTKELRRKAGKTSSLIEAIATAFIIVIFATCIAIIIGLAVHCVKSAELIFTIMIIGGLFSAILLSILTLTVFIPFVSKWNLDDKVYKYLVSIKR